MKSYMPGESGWTDHGPRTTVHPAVEAYAKRLKGVRVKMRAGRLLGLQDPRRYRFGDMKHVKAKRSMAGVKGLELVERSRRSDAEEDYLAALYEVFHGALDALTESHKLYLRGLMDGKSTRQQADEYGITQPAIVQGRKRALEALAEVLGARGLEDKHNIRAGIVRRSNFPLTEWLPAFTEGV